MIFAGNGVRYAPSFGAALEDKWYDDLGDEAVCGLFDAQAATQPIKAQTTISPIESEIESLMSVTPSWGSRRFLAL